MSSEGSIPVRDDHGPPGLSGVDVTPPAEIAKQLTGNLPCVSCRYNLRGLSVKGVCPECGTAVRAAILAAVDPYAAVLQPVFFPRLTAVGIILWAGAALAAGLLTWGMRLCDVAAIALDHPIATQPLARAALFCIAVSGAGALALIRPHARIPLVGSVAAAVGVLATFALGAVYSRLHVRFDPSHASPYLHMGLSLIGRSQLRLFEGALLLVIVLALRPNARLLAARSLLLRLGRVDRQTMLAMAAAITLGAVGDTLQIAGTSINVGSDMGGFVVSTLGLFMIVVGAMLLTVGLFGVLLDAVRIATVLVRPSLSHAQVVGPETAALHPIGDRP